MLNVDRRACELESLRVVELRVNTGVWELLAIKRYSTAIHFQLIFVAISGHIAVLTDDALTD
jgi:hypothetical protein